MPVVSINISCFNRKEMLRECIKSFLSQTFKDFEIIIVDDGSEDDLTFVTKLDSRVKYFRQEHGGMAKGLNSAMKKSTGRYIMPFGSDDIATDNDMLKEMVDVLESDPQCDVVFCDHWFQYSDGRKLRIKYRNTNLGNQKEFYKEMLKSQTIAHGGTLWKKEKYPEYDIQMAPADDWDLFLTAIERGSRFYHIPKRLWTYRVGHVRMSGTREMDEACKKVLLKRGLKV